jgi:hypothetical protein
MFNEITQYWAGLQDNDKGVLDAIRYDHQEKKFHVTFKGLKIRDPEFVDNGYLLISRYSKKQQQCIVELFSLETQKVLHTWTPDIDAIIERCPELKGHTQRMIGKGAAAFSKNTYQCRHPLLLEGGDLLIQCVDGPLTRIDTEGNIEWQINRGFHHSLEKTKDGHFMGCIVVEPQVVQTPLDVRDDGFAIISNEGEILEEFSVMEIFIKNGLGGLIYGVGDFEYDRIHLNDAHPVVRQSDYADVGDVMLSCVSLSTIALYRPSTGKVIWAYTGPWEGQHDVNDLGDGTFSVFANNLINTGSSAAEKVYLEHSGLYIYNPSSGELSAPYRDMMQKLKVRSITEGRLRILGNGDAFVEETNKGRLLRISPTKVRWEYVNAVTDHSIGALHWCRYLRHDDVDTSWIKE